MENTINAVPRNLFEEFGRPDVPFSALSQNVVTPKAITLPPNFRRLVYEKRKAGLTHAQAELVVRAQIEHDEALVEAETKAASKEKTTKPANV